MAGGVLGHGEGFNPRTRESATAKSREVAQPRDVSIHALVRVRPAVPTLQDI